jgi:hypothetical protein
MKRNETGRNGDWMAPIEELRAEIAALTTSRENRNLDGTEEPQALLRRSTL